MFDLDTTKCQIQQRLCHYITYIISISSTEHDNTGAALGAGAHCHCSTLVLEMIEEKEVSVVKNAFYFLVWSFSFSGLLPIGIVVNHKLSICINSNKRNLIWFNVTFMLSNVIKIIQ